MLNGFCFAYYRRMLTKQTYTHSPQLQIFRLIRLNLAVAINPKRRIDHSVQYMNNSRLSFSFRLGRPNKNHPINLNTNKNVQIFESSLINVQIND
jgi:hypothetical protein